MPSSEREPGQAPRSKRWLVALLWIAWIAAAALSVWLLMRLSALEPRPGVVHLQLAGTSDRAEQVIVQWGVGERQDVRRAIRLDNLFIPAYAVTLIGLCLWGKKRLRFPTARRMGVVLAWGTGLAAGLDYIENWALTRTLEDSSSNLWPTISAAVAWPKFFILGPALVYGLGSSLNRLWRGFQDLLRRKAQRPQASMLQKKSELDQAAQAESSSSEGASSPGMARRVARMTLRGILGMNPPGVLSQSLPHPDRSAFDRPEAAPEGLAHLWRPAKGRIGICCSGGGVRSAAYNLGALQALQSSEGDGVFDRASYLSAVSGGAYIAAAYALVETDTEAKETFGKIRAFAPGSPEVEYLRNRSSYLAHKLGGRLRLVARLLIGLSVNVLFVWVVLFVVSGPLAWLLTRDFLYPELQGRKFDFKPHLWWAVGWPLLAGYASALVAVLRRFRQDVFYHRAVRAAIFFLALSGLLFGVLIVLPYLAWAIPAAVRAFLHWLPGKQAETTGGTRNYIWLMEVLGVAGIGTALLRLLAKHTSKIALVALALVAPVLVALTLILLTGDAAASEINFLGRTVARQSWWLTGGVAALLGTFYGISDQTTWSMHPFYKRRLSSAFALQRCIPSSPSGDPSPSESFPIVEASTYDRLRQLSNYRPKWYRAACGGDRNHMCSGRVSHKCRKKGCAHTCDPGPELVVCAAANISDEGATPPGRDSVSFTFSAGWIGGPEVGWIRTTDMEEALGTRRKEDITLPAAVAISGAALSPAMGKMSPPIAAPLLALLNARLGVWLPNPRWVRACVFQDVTWSERPRVLYLLKEVFGRYSLQDPFLYVTDGGHWENLGLVELLRRGCTEIYCFDASGDDVDTFFTLGEAVALARTTLGVEIDIDPEPLEPSKRAEKTKRERGKAETTPEKDGNKPAAQRSATDHIVGSFTYPNRTKGLIVFVKTTVTDRSPWDVKSYAEKDPDFPTHGTVDQLFTDEKFEAYRALGWSTALRAVATMARAKHPHPFRRVARLAYRSGR